MRIWITSLLFVAIISAGCKDKGSTGLDEYLIRIQNYKITVYDFNTALEIAKIAYPHKVMQNASSIKAVQLRLLNQMVEELILFAEAGRLNISVSESELKKAIADIKVDYPDDQFEQTLLENAISYVSWEKRLKTRLIMEKVVKLVLEDKISISPEDIAKYYELNFSGNDKSAELEKEPENINEIIVKNLRKQKAEKAYDGWIKNLKIKYKDSIEINQKKLEEIVGVEQIQPSPLK